MFQKYLELEIYLFFDLDEIFEVVEYRRQKLDNHFDIMTSNIGTAELGCAHKNNFFRPF